MARAREMLGIFDRKILGTEIVSPKEAEELGEYLARLKRTTLDRPIGLSSEGQTSTGRLKRFILSHLGEVVEKEDLLKVAYPETRPVSADRCLSIMVKKIKKSVNNIGVEIQIVRGRGYRVGVKRD